MRFSQIAKIINEPKARSKLPSGTAITVVKDDQVIYQGDSVQQLLLRLMSLTPYASNLCLRQITYSHFNVKMKKYEVWNFLMKCLKNNLYKKKRWGG